MAILITVGQDADAGLRCLPGTSTQGDASVGQVSDRDRVFDTVGLTVFIGVVGLGAGPAFVSGLQKSGASLILVGLVVAVLPHTIAILFGRHVLRMNPLILLGACSGAGTVTAALRALEEEAHSKLPALGYTVPYAVGNILLTAWGPVIVALMRASA
jgi:putative transport protein